VRKLAAAEEKRVSLQKDLVKNRYHELFKESVDYFYKNTIQIGPCVKASISKNWPFHSEKHEETSQQGTNTKLWQAAQTTASSQEIDQLPVWRDARLSRESKRKR
jgi:hypothetical protein